MTATNQRTAGRGRTGRVLSRAFSIVELVAVLVIVGIIAATVIPVMNNLGGKRGAAAARWILSDLAYARQRAVATGTRSWVVFDAPAGEWSVLVEDPDSPGRAGASILTDPTTQQPLTARLESAMPGVTIASASFDGDPEVGFDWLGRPLNRTESLLAAQGEVVLGGGHTVVVEAGSGQIRYQAP